MGTPVLMEDHLQRAGRLIREEEARAEQAGQAPDFQAVLSEQIHLARLDDGECYVMLIHLYGLLEVRNQGAMGDMKRTGQPLTTSASPVSPNSSEPVIEAAADAFKGESPEISESAISPACPAPAMNNPSTRKPWWVLLGFDGCLVIVLSWVTVYTFFEALTCSHFQSCSTATAKEVIELVAWMYSTITFGLAALARRGLLW